MSSQQEDGRLGTCAFQTVTIETGTAMKFPFGLVLVFAWILSIRTSLEDIHAGKLMVDLESG